MIRRKLYHVWILGLAGLQIYSCKEPYLPPEVKGNPGWLVVDGFLNAGPDSSYIMLSRTRSLQDSSKYPESKAHVMVLGPAGQNFTLQESGVGTYVADHLDLSVYSFYKLRIISADGRIYESDSFPALQTPPIDSLSWQQDSIGVSIYAYSHDPTNQVRNYRWEYVETWKYNTGIDALIYYDGTRVLPITQANQIYDCWNSALSTNLLLASSMNLDEDVINHQLICEVEIGSEKMSIDYSILVNQYGISPQAFDYWQNLRKLTELTGSLFDPTPSQVTGNIKCISNPSEIVLGFMGASTVAKKRIFINNLELSNWDYYPYYIDCLQANSDRQFVSASDPARDEKLYDYLLQPRHLYTLIDFPNSAVYVMAENYCADCRAHGGTNQKPAFWH